MLEKKCYVNLGGRKRRGDRGMDLMEYRAGGRETRKRHPTSDLHEFWRIESMGVEKRFNSPCFSSPFIFAWPAERSSTTNAHIIAGGKTEGS